MEFALRRANHDLRLGRDAFLGNAQRFGQIDGRQVRHQQQIAQESVLLFRGDLQNFFFAQGRQPRLRARVAVEEGGAILPNNDVRRAAPIGCAIDCLSSPR